MTKTKEQLEEEKKISLSIRIKPLDLDGMSQDDLISKANELWETIVRLETEKYDLEERQKRQDYDVSWDSLILFGQVVKVGEVFFSWRNLKKDKSNTSDKRLWRKDWIQSKWEKWGYSLLFHNEFIFFRALTGKYPVSEHIICIVLADKGSWLWQMADVWETGVRSPVWSDLWPLDLFK